MGRQVDPTDNEALETESLTPFKPVSHLHIVLPFQI